MGLVVGGGAPVTALFASVGLFCGGLRTYTGKCLADYLGVMSVPTLTLSLPNNSNTQNKSKCARVSDEKPKC